MINTVTFNGVNFWEDLGAALSAPISYPIPAEIKETITVKGANGSLTEATGYFNMLEIEAEFKVLIGHGEELETHNFNSLKRRINILFNTIRDNRLMFSDVPEKYYKVSSCGLTSVTKISEYEATFKVIFKCDPFLYSINDVEIPVRNGDRIVYNGDIPNTPIIRLDIRDSDGTFIVNNNGDILKIFTSSDGVIEINNNPYTIAIQQGKPIKTEGNPIVFKKGENQLKFSGATVISAEVLKNERYLG